MAGRAAGPPRTMIALARAVMARAYAPYSRFRVGAVLRGANGKLYAGCNVENAAYPQGMCAEASAIAAMVADGETRIVEAVVMGEGGTALIAPCGGCRQQLREFADDAVPIHLCGPQGVRRTVTLGELLPLAFGPANLKRRKAGRDGCRSQVRSRRSAAACAGLSRRCAGIVLGSGLGDYRRAGRNRRHDPLCRPARLSRARRRRPCRHAGARPHRRHAGRAAAGARALLRARPAPT